MRELVAIGEQALIAGFQALIRVCPIHSGLSVEMEGFERQASNATEDVRLFHQPPQNARTAFGRFPIENRSVGLGPHRFRGKFALLNLKEKLHAALQSVLERGHSGAVSSDFL